MKLEVFKSCVLSDMKYVTKEFLEVSRFSQAKQQQRNVQNKTLLSVHFGVVVVELIKYKCGGIVRNEI